MSRQRRDILLKPLPPESPYFCPICSDLLEKPMTAKCGHNFCEQCTKVKPNCPICGKKLEGTFILSEKVAEFIKNLDVICGYGEYPKVAVEDPCIVDIVIKPLVQCPWRGKYKDLNGHLSNECNYHLLSCLNPGCTFKGLRSALLQHQPICGFKPTKCEWCGTEGIASLEKKMHEDTCTEKKILCLLECGTEMKRKDYQNHRRKLCPNNYTNIHVRGFSEDVTENDLFDLFKPFGDIVHLKLVPPGEKNNKWPYCFVCYKTPESAHQAQTALQNYSYKKRSLAISKAVTPWNIWSEYRKKFPDCCVYIRNLPGEISEEMLLNKFTDFGFVFATHIVMVPGEGPNNKVPTGGAYICFGLSGEAGRAVEFCTNNDVFGIRLNIQKYVPEEERKGPHFYQKPYKPYHQNPQNQYIPYDYNMYQQPYGYYYPNYYPQPYIPQPAMPTYDVFLYFVGKY